MGIVTWALWGLFVGIAARFLVRGKAKISLVWTILLGAAGSVIGGLLCTELLEVGEAGDFNFLSFLIAVAVSVALLTVAMQIARALPQGSEDG